MKEEVILKLVQIQNQFRFLHWQTTFYPKHKAYGEVYEGLDEKIDEFVEAMMGKYGRPEFTESFSIMFQDLNSLSIQHFIDGICEFLISLNEKLDPKVDSDLLNLRDEMMGIINKLKYLLTLK